MTHVEWDDAVEHKEININDIINNPTSKYLLLRKSYGKIIKEDEHGIIILNDNINHSQEVIL